MIAVMMLLVAQAGEAPADELANVPQPALTATISSTPLPDATVTLAQLLDAADRQSIDRRITIEQERRAHAEVRQAWTALLPGLSVSAGWTHNQEEVVVPFGGNQVSLQPLDQFELIARVDLPLIDTTRWMRAAASEAARDSAVARQQLTADQIKRAVATGWFSYAGALSLRESAERNVAVSQAQLKLQEVRTRAGAATELELLRARAELERNRQSVADAHRLIAVARRTLTTLSGMDPGEGARLPALDMRPAAPLEELQGRIGELPGVRAAENDARGADKLATASKLALVPQVTANVTERLTSEAGITGKNANLSLGVNLAWRLDVPTFQAMDAQSANAGVAALGVERARLAARDQIHADWQSLQAALVKVTAAKAQVEAAQRAHEVAASRYQLGASTQLDVIQADRDLFAAEALQIQAQIELASARVALQISSGLPVEIP